jgi:hypothetical protein
MNDIEAWLREVCNTLDGPYLRPFAPNPQWRKADVLIVGTNPATPLRSQFSSFDEYWLGLTQHPEMFDRQYQLVHGGGQTRSTARTQRLLAQLKPLNALVTNVYAFPSEDETLIRDKPSQRKIGRDILIRLVASSRPRAAIFHGSEALRMAASLALGHLDPYMPLLEQTAYLRESRSTRVYVYPHFSGRGVRKGFRVRQMDSDLANLAVSLKAQVLLS